MIKLKQLAIDGTRHGRLVHATKAIMPTYMSFFHNVWAFPIWRKLGRGCYISSHVIGCFKNELAFHKDPFMHILLICCRYCRTLSREMSRISSIVSKSTICASVHIFAFQALSLAMCRLLAPSTPLVRWSWFHLPKKTAKS